MPRSTCAIRPTSSRCRKPQSRAGGVGSALAEPRGQGGHIGNEHSRRNQNQPNSLVEGADERPVVRLGGLLARLDLGCVRLHDVPADHGADLAGIRRAADRGRVFAERDFVAAARRRSRLGMARRPDRAQDAADDLDPVVFDLQFHRRLLADVWVSLSVPRAAGHRHGRGMAGRRGSRDGVLAGALPRVHERDAAGLVEPRISSGQPDLWVGVQCNRLARLADDRSPSRPFGRLCALLCQRAAGVAGEPPAPARRAARGACSASQHLQAGLAWQHLDGELVDGERLPRLLLDQCVVCDPSAEGSEPQPGSGRDTDHVCEPRGISRAGLLGLVRGPLRPPLVDDHPCGDRDPCRPPLSADHRLHLDRRRVRSAGLLRPGDLRPEPRLSFGTVPDRGTGDRERLLLSPGGDIRRLCSAGSDLVRQPLRSRLCDPDADRHLRWSGELCDCAAARTGDEGKDPRAGSRRRLTAIDMCRTSGLLFTFVALAAALPADAQSPAPSANATSAFDGTYVGVSAENNSRSNTLAGSRANPQGYGGARGCSTFRAPARLTITNGLARVRWGDRTLEGQVTPEGVLTMSTGYGQRFDGRIDDQHVIKGQAVGYCTYTLTWQKQG